MKPDILARLFQQRSQAKPLLVWQGPPGHRSGQPADAHLCGPSLMSRSCLNTAEGDTPFPDRKS